MFRKFCLLFLCVSLFGLVGEVKAEPGQGNILIEWWIDSWSGTDLASLRVDSSFTDPDGSQWRDIFDIPFSKPSGEPISVLVDNYAAQFRGYIYPPGTGDYTFCVASDDHSIVWLSTNGASEKLA